MNQKSFETKATVILVTLLFEQPIHAKLPTVTASKLYVSKDERELAIQKVESKLIFLVLANFVISQNF